MVNVVYHHFMPKMGKPCRLNQTYISRTDYRHFHFSRSPSLPFRSLYFDAPESLLDKIRSISQRHDPKIDVPYREGLVTPDDPEDRDASLLQKILTLYCTMGISSLYEFIVNILQKFLRSCLHGEAKKYLFNRKAHQAGRGVFLPLTGDW